MLMMGIALIFLVIGGVGTMYLVMQENAEVADEVVVVSAHVNERVKEDVAITRDAGGGIELHSNRIKDPEKLISQIAIRLAKSVHSEPVLRRIPPYARQER